MSMLMVAGFVLGAFLGYESAAAAGIGVEIGRLGLGLFAGVIGATLANIAERISL